MGFQQGFRINTNTAALDTYRAYSKSQAGLERNIERLSSGLRINKAADDTAGLAISQRMNNQVRGMQQANRNVQQANNMLQTAKGGLNETGNILGRMRELALQSASDTVNSDDRGSLNLEFGQLKDEVSRIAKSTDYNEFSLLDGMFDSGVNALLIQVTPNSDGDNNSYNGMDIIAIQIGDFQVDSFTFGMTDTVNEDGGTAVGGTVDASTADFLDLSNLAKSQTSITNLDTMIGAVNNARSDIGAKQKRLEFTSSNLMNSIQNTAASMSTIRDADFAAEAAELAKNQILASQAQPC